ncbi:unnamed protein product, partial [Pneumocystis jirovecii]
MVLTESSINPSVLKAHYGIRGEIYIKAEKIRKKLEEGVEDIPFRDIICANIGNPQKFDHKPITFFRQVLSLVEYPDLLEKHNIENTKKLFPKDAINRAKILLNNIEKVGAYSASQGVENRDGHPSSPDDIFLTAGASSAAMLILQMLISHNNIGIMVPIPQYPLYSAVISLFNGKPVLYYLEEDNNWSMDIISIENAFEEAEKNKIQVKAIVVINPGNPTGACLTRDIIESIVKFSEKRDLLIIADEVYQENIYDDDLKFISFKKVLRDLQLQYPGRYNVQLVSLHSVSKGTIGECGIRGGYLELTGFDDFVKFQLYKLVSISLCPPVPGQIMVDLMVNPPKKNDESYKIYKKEMNYIKEVLKERAKRLKKAFDEMEGVECRKVQTSLKKAILEARSLNKSPDEFYCIKLLETTGVCVVPGSSFGQVQGTYHFRTTFLSDGNIDERLMEPNLKDFIIIAATASTDIGIVCRNKDDLVWKTLIISNETYRASLPYSLLNDCDTSPIGIALDFTLSENIQKPLFPNDEPKESQPLPILYLLNNDYFLTGYYVLYIDAIKAGKICSSMCLAKENIPDINFNQNTAVATKECSFGFTPLHMPNLPTLNSKSMSEKTSDSHTFRQMINNSISFGVSSFGVPSFGIPVFGNTSFGSSANTGTENLVFKKKEFGSTSQGIKSSFASFASMTKSNNDSPFGNLIQNSSQMYGNKSENIFSESKSSFSFNTSRPENKDDDIEDDELQIENDNALEDRIECISDKEPKIISDSPFGGIMNFFNINNEKKDSTNIQSQQFNSSESSVETSNLCLFERENNLSVDNMSVKSSN